LELVKTTTAGLVVLSRAVVPGAGGLASTIANGEVSPESLITPSIVSLSSGPPGSAPMATVGAEEAMAAVGEEPSPPPYHAFSYAPLVALADAYRAAGAEVFARTPAESLLREGGRVVGARAGGRDIRAKLGDAGVDYLAAPVSGNPKAARAGMLSVAVSGPRDAFERALPYLQMLGRSVSYVGDGEAARLVKICHNIILGVVAQVLAETTVLAESGGISRADYLSFINESVLGSVFSRYKTPAFVNLNYTPTFTGHLLRKDLELGLEAARERNVPLPLTAITHEIVMNLIGQGFGDQDFAALLEIAARGANLQLVPDTRFVPDGLGSSETPAAEAR